MLTAGSLFACSPQMAHFIYADEEAVIQLNMHKGVAHPGEPIDTPR